MHTTDMEKEFLSADEAAEVLHMHPRTVRRLLACGELPGTRLGRQWRISLAAVRKLIEGAGIPSVVAGAKVRAKKAAKKSKGE